MKGIDVSSNNGTVNWQEVKKCRCGVCHDQMRVRPGHAAQDDKQFAKNVEACIQLGIPFGVYLYSYALKVADAVGEANNALRFKGLDP